MMLAATPEMAQSDTRATIDSEPAVWLSPCLEPGVRRGRVFLLFAIFPASPWRHQSLLIQSRLLPVAGSDEEEEARRRLIGYRNSVEDTFKTTKAGASAIRPAKPTSLFQDAAKT